MSYLRDDQAIILAQYIPSKERLTLIHIILDANGGNISKTAKDIGITRAQLYRYLGRAERVDVPSDEISARIVKAAYKLRPAQTKDFFKFLLKQFRTLISRL